MWYFILCCSRVYTFSRCGKALEILLRTASTMVVYVCKSICDYGKVCNNIMFIQIILNYNYNNCWKIKWRWKFVADIIPHSVYIVGVCVYIYVLKWESYVCKDYVGVLLFYYFKILEFKKNNSLCIHTEQVRNSWNISKLIRFWKFIEMKRMNVYARDTNNHQALLFVDIRATYRAEPTFSYFLRNDIYLK